MRKKKERKENLITFHVSSIHNYSEHSSEHSPSIGGEKKVSERKFMQQNDKSMRDEKELAKLIVKLFKLNAKKREMKSETERYFRLKAFQSHKLLSFR